MEDIIDYPSGLPPLSSPFRSPEPNPKRRIEISSRSPSSPLKPSNQKRVLHRISRKLRKSERKKYTLQDLQDLRHAFRGNKAYPNNIHLNIESDLFESLFCGKSIGLTINVYTSEERAKLQRQKQIDFAKNTIGYQNYLLLIPKSERIPGSHPSTPQCGEMDDDGNLLSKRRFAGKLKKWRKALHLFDNLYEETGTGVNETVNNNANNTNNNGVWINNLSHKSYRIKGRIPDKSDDNHDYGYDHDHDHDRSRGNRSDNNNNNSDENNSNYHNHYNYSYNYNDTIRQKLFR